MYLQIKRLFLYLEHLSLKQVYKFHLAKRPTQFPFQGPCTCYFLLLEHGYNLLFKEKSYEYVKF